MRISEELLNKLADYFVAEDIHMRTGRTFYQFLLGEIKE
jgi:hypothetical protein